MDHDGQRKADSVVILSPSIAQTMRIGQTAVRNATIQSRKRI
ncbi:hypothetical protein M2324_002888 [Rhodovulum sulfidophilum]|nr:hypothetical protein [Rhodovulum sulfidophilum]MCW2304478.1 hypothetical protein [Rhodovulum sulfidophilum]